LLTEEQRLNTQKITELFDMLELRYAKEAVKEVVLDDNENEKKEIIQEAKLIVDLKELVTSILMISDLSRQRE